VADAAIVKHALRPEPALSLAALRVVVPAMVLLAPGFRQGVRVAAWAPARWVVPEGLHWFVAHVPISPRWALTAQVLTAFCALCAMVGIRARLALGALTLSTFYLFSIAQLTGWVWHDMHLLWFCALLAASPCDDVLAVDATRPLLSQGVRYARPLLYVRLLLGAVYFFPGLHKLMQSGLSWALSNNLRNQLWWKWAEHGSVPHFRVDHFPWLLHGGGLFVLFFELSFPLLVLFRRTRPVAAAAGIAFHVLARGLFLIPFESLWVCYVALVDLRPLVRRLPRIGKRLAEPAGAPPPARSVTLWAPVAVGSILLVPAVVQGARGQMQSYPFACYPTFQWQPGTRMPDLVVTAVGPQGREVELPHARDDRGYRTQRQWAEVWALAGVTAKPDARRLQGYYRSLVQHEPDRHLARGATRVRFYRVYRSVAPEDRGKPPLERRLLLELRQREPATTR
jgi:hypothetical protein